MSAERAAREATSLLRVLAASCYAGSGLSRLGTQAASRAGRSGASARRGGARGGLKFKSLRVRVWSSARL